MASKATEESRCCLRLILILLHGSDGDCDCENASPDNVENNSNDDWDDCNDGDFTTTLPRVDEDHHNDGCWNAAALALAL